MTTTMSAPMATTYAAPQMSYAPTYGGYPTMQQPMITTEAVEKQRIEATQQLTSVSTAQEKMLKDQLDMQLQMLETETARQIEMTKQQCTQQLAQQKMALEQAYAQQDMQLKMMIEQQAMQMQAQASQYKMQADMQQKMAAL